MKYFDWIFYGMLIVAGILTVSLQPNLKQDLIPETQIDEMNIC